MRKGKGQNVKILHGLFMLNRIQHGIMRAHQSFHVRPYAICAVSKIASVHGGDECLYDLEAVIAHSDFVHVRERKTYTELCIVPVCFWVRPPLTARIP